MSVYLFAATADEARALRHIPSHPGDPRHEQTRPWFVITGVGPAAARATAIRTIGEARRISGNNPGAAVFCAIGTCGSLSSRLATGTIALYTSCMTTAHSGAPLQVESSPALVDRIAAALAARRIPYEKVVGVTSPTVVARYSEKVQLAEQGASVVDMESYDILAAAREAGIAGVVVRAVSDSLNQNVPDFTPAIRGDGSVDSLRAARIALRSPLATARLMSAQRRALRNLRLALEVIWGADCLGPMRL